jgi:tetratricopeptide (TPR) repeat protein
MSDELVSANARRGSVMFDQGRYPEAEKYFREALAQEPNDPETLAKLALCELNLHRTPAAYETIQRAIGFAPEAAHLHALKAFIEVDMNKIGEALKSASAALELDPECDDAFAAQASAYIRRQEWAKAEKSARAALEINPDHAGAANQLAHALRLQNRLHESGDQIAYMLAQDPEDADTHVAAGWTALQRGQREQAEKHFLEALRLEAGNTGAREGLKEAFRAKSPLYRAYLNYCFFMQRFTADKQWLVIIGLLVVVRFANAALGPYGWIVSGLYLLFVLWVHVARPVGNLQLVFDRAARHALDGYETIEAWVCGGGVIAGILLCLLGMVANLALPLLVGATLVAAAFPFAYTFTNRARGRWLFGAVGAFVVVVGFVNAGMLFAGQKLDGPIPGLLSVALFAVIACTWLCNVSALNSRR